MIDIDEQLLAAQQQRDERILDYDLGLVLDRVFGDAEAASGDARDKLQRVLRYYAQSPHPYRACVADQMARFGPGKTEQICGTLKQMIRSTSRWRHEDSFAGTDLDPDPCSYTFTDEERTQIVTKMTDEDWAALEEAIASATH